MVTLAPFVLAHPAGSARRGIARAVLAVGPAAALLTAATTAMTRAAPDVPAPGVPTWTVVVSLAALVLGVPHGAVDHLTLARPLSASARLAAGSAYLGVAAAAAALVLGMPAPAFVAVLALSVWHFGSGDVEASRELRGAPDLPAILRPAHLVVLGAVPVLLPLTSPAAVATVSALDPRLAVVVDPSVTAPVRAAVVALAAVVLVALVAMRRAAEALEVGALVALALVAAPLVAFAVYFAGWHALRHTLRLALVEGAVDRARLRLVLRQGTPALVVSAGAVASALVIGGAVVAPTVLWTALAVVWGLTVPHMLVVSAFDRRRRAAASARAPYA